MSGDARELFSRFIPDGDVAPSLQDLPRLLSESFAQTMTHPARSGLPEAAGGLPARHAHLHGRHTARPTPWSPNGSSKAATGKEYKPERLPAGLRRVRPRTTRRKSKRFRSCSTVPPTGAPAALTELRETLTSAPEHFTEANLRRAFRGHPPQGAGRHHLDGQARGREYSPLLTAEERVNAAVATVTAGRTFTAEHSSGWSTSAHHLVQNLSIDREDFEAMPILSRPRRLGTGQPRLRRPA